MRDPLSKCQLPWAKRKHYKPMPLPFPQNCQNFHPFDVIASFYTHHFLYIVFHCLILNVITADDTHPENHKLKPVASAG